MKGHAIGCTLVTGDLPQVHVGAGGATIGEPIVMAGLSSIIVYHLHAVLHRAPSQAERLDLVARNV